MVSVVDTLWPDRHLCDCGKFEAYRIEVGPVVHGSMKKAPDTVMLLGGSRASNSIWHSDFAEGKEDD